MDSRGQSSVEWLLTHAWSIIVVLSVSAVLFYAGVFEASARPRFEGLASAGLQPIPDKVQLYSDGVMVFTVLNTRPYSIKFDWVEVAPIADREDTVQTLIDDVLHSNEIGVYEINASNLVSMAAASILLPIGASAEDEYVDFYVCIMQTHSAGGESKTNKVCGTARRISRVYETLGNPCEEHLVCECETDSDCPLACQACSIDYGGGAGEPPYHCDNIYVCDMVPPFPGGMCKSTVDHPEGECAPV